MGDSGDGKKHESFTVPHRSLTGGAGEALPAAGADPASPCGAGGFYEIEYGSGPVGEPEKPSLKAQRIDDPPKDPVMARFRQMREIARDLRASRGYSDFWGRGGRDDSAEIFFLQGMFMKDFEDGFTGHAPLRHFPPNYHMMGYEQLRTYFTWRTRVRAGEVTGTSLPYAVLHVYELLNNIGTDSPRDGLEKLTDFWQRYRAVDRAIDVPVIPWLKDYHIYYALHASFARFVRDNGLEAEFPEMEEAGDAVLDLYCAISKYDIRKSAFFTDGNAAMISACFSHVIGRIRDAFAAAGMHFDDALFRPAKKLTAWKPFKDALFFEQADRPDMKTVMSKNELYIRRENVWWFSNKITSEKGRMFIGYVMRRMESELRRLTGFKGRLTASGLLIHPDTVRVLENKGLHIEKIVPEAVAEYHREANRTRVEVDQESLARIRADALATQEALTVEEPTVPQAPLHPPKSARDVTADSGEGTPEERGDMWGILRDELSDVERRALDVILKGGDVKAFADANGVMVEVLMEGVNEKAADIVGDSLTDGDFVLFEDYRSHVKELVS